LIRTAGTLALLLACAAAGAPANAATNASKSAAAQAELKALKSRIAAIQKRLAEAEESKTEAADALQASERGISDANRAVAELAEQARAANAAVAQVRARIAAAESRLAGQRSALSKLLRQRYVSGRPDVLALLLSGRDANAVARELTYLTYIGRARAELIVGLRSNLDELGRLAAEAQARAGEIAAIAAEQARQRSRLESEKRERARLLARIAHDIERQRREIGTLRRDETRLTRLIEQLAKAIASTPKARAPRERQKAERVPEPEREERHGGAFAGLRGSLSLPVRGELANRFGSPRQDGGIVWKGLFIAARVGEEVRAVAAGRVVFADWLRGFGNLLIIDHGESYMSLYGYNETLYKGVGDVVGRGERIAAVGATGGHGQSGLYFEMRHEGRPFDPMTWVSRK